MRRDILNALSDAKNEVDVAETKVPDCNWSEDDKREVITNCEDIIDAIEDLMDYVNTIILIES